MSEERCETVSELREKIELLCAENEYLSMKQNRNRARSITVGTAFGGVVEVSMRADIGNVYAQMQPTEGVELIEQLAAGLGIEIAMNPSKILHHGGVGRCYWTRVPLDRIAGKVAAWQFMKVKNLKRNIKKINFRKS